MSEFSKNVESPEVRLRRLRMRSWRRGMKEMDLILGGFADKHLEYLSSSELNRHEALMDENDQEIYAWITGAEPTPAKFKDQIARILATLSVR